jgi:hypothetical protein
VDRENDMKVTCNTTKEFLENLADVLAERVLGRTIYVSLTRTPVGGRDSVKLSVTLQYSAVVNLADGEGQYLLEAAENCGFDYVDASQEFKGGDAARALREALDGFCVKRGLVVKPGFVSE